jgi:hypothetical protein
MTAKATLDACKPTLLNEFAEFHRKDALARAIDYHQAFGHPQGPIEGGPEKVIATAKTFYEFLTGKK